MRPAVSKAIAWRIIAELFRRYQASCNLFVAETAPIGGFYHGLSLFARDNGFPGKELIFINDNGNFHFHLPFAEGPPVDVDLGWNPDADQAYALAFLEALDPKEQIDAIATKIGFPEPKGASLPESTPAVLAIRLIAALLERHMLGRVAPQVINAWLEADLHPELGQFYGMVARDMPEGSWEEKAKVALHYWIIRMPRGGEVLMDIRGQLHCPDRLSAPWDFADDYARLGRRLEPLVNRLEELLI